ncbi:MAG: tellurite resistance/C4-dicarboxylate transporter family protein [Acidobacteria bacterium]|nr:tellurite resistance/C4-dicarboxylate transporter family protein [Acidobacteriota bacterium]
MAGAIADLFPGYFALVMATGITSVASHLLGLEAFAWALVYLNTAAFGLLWILLLIRLVRFSLRVRADLSNHARGPGFFTVPAGTCVFGSQLVLVAGQFQIALILWFVGLVLWVLTMYGFFMAMTVRENKPALEKGLNGAWLIAGVATQSISVLGTLLAGHYMAYADLILFFTVCMFLVGCLLYLVIITLIFYQFTFLSISSETLTPPYWINMGAVAITTLAGARLIIAAPESHFLTEIVPFLRGFTLFFWSAGTWWIPLLFMLGFWRHVYKRFPLRYDPQYWGMVFPLGMYTTCTFQLSKALDFEPLMWIPRVFIYLAIAAWVAAFAGLIYTLIPKPERDIAVPPAA